MVPPISGTLDTRPPSSATAPRPVTADSLKRPDTSPSRPNTSRSTSTGFNASRGTLGSTQKSQVSDFSSDVGRKKFGFSHEEIDDATAYYEGQFKLYQRCGEGTLHNPTTGAKYVGQFQNDRPHGYGDQVWSDGSRYRGQWRNGQKHGSGEYISPDELRYTGQWENGRRHGQGKQEYANHDRYSGWWFRGMCSGVGTYFFADGSRYEGMWSNGRYDGQGVFYGSDGTRERQWYSGGLLMKREVLPPGAPPKPGSRRDMMGGKVLSAQTRLDMHKPTMLPKPQASKYLIRRETAGHDLSAPPLTPKAAPECLQAAVELDLTVQVSEPAKLQDESGLAVEN